MYKVLCVYVIKAISIKLISSEYRQSEAKTISRNQSSKAQFNCLAADSYYERLHLLE